MAFFEDVDGSQVVENHIRKVMRLEEEKAKALLARYTSVRRDLRDRLENVRADSFTAQQLRGTLLQVESAINTITSNLKAEMGDAAYDAAFMGVEHLLEELKKFDKMFTGAVTPININAAAIADDTSNFLLNQYQASLDAYGTDLIRQITNNLTNAVLQNKGFGEAVQGLNQFMVGEEWKLQRIARTELHNVYGLGKLNGMKKTRDDFLPSLKKTLIHPMDARTASDSKYAASLNLIVDIDEPFKYRWGGKIRIFQNPPDRPNDRSILVPYREEWGSA